MSFELYNTQTKKKEKFKALNRGKVNMYTCGPTVYDYAHIGNFRANLTADILRRWLVYLGYEVTHIKNITDVGHLVSDAETGEDKIEAAAKKKKVDPFEISRLYTKKFFEDEQKLNILPAHKFPRATKHIKQMIKAIEVLIKKKLAYTKNGNVFYAISKFPSYGKLSGNTMEKLKQEARVEKHPDKKNPFDFALWKKAEPGHIMKWDSPWSEGYPGWHIECSIMSMEYLGNTLDIHTGGEDNIFPHHENEIAQSEGITGKPFCNFWSHTSWLLVDNQKMSKSKGNFYTLRDLEKIGYSPLAFRMLVLQSHYKKHLNFTKPAIAAAQEGLQKIYDFIETLLLQKGYEKGGALPREINKLIREYKGKFEKALNDNLNTPQAVASVFEFVRKINSLAPLRKQERKPIYNFLLKLDQVLGLGLDRIGKQKTAIPAKVKALVKKREEARQKKDFKKADQLRTEIEKLGYKIKDSEKGTIVKEIKKAVS